MLNYDRRIVEDTKMKQEEEEMKKDVSKVPILKRIKFRMKLENDEVITTLYLNGLLTTGIAYFGMYMKEQWLLTSIVICTALTIGNTITYIAKMKKIKQEAK